ncbi:MAG: purine-nucleoside phosphorylase [Oscillospiraceae bacterium]|nr:purine-nucleoside phosphorylase [Oscillospiraceae bacterium]
MSTHINAPAGSIAPRILLPGDPLRAKYIAENFMDEPVQFNSVRGMLGFSGTYKGIPVAVMGTGMGIPSISIYVEELMAEYGVKTLIRVGTCGSLRADIGLRDLILAQGACTDNGFLNYLFPGTYAPIADFDLLRTAYDIAAEKGIRSFTGLIKSSDMFYGETDVPGADNWAKYGVLGVEMEAAALYTHAAKHGCRALAICSVSDSLVTGEEIDAAARERSLNDMITVALETAIRF